jgi:transcriptional regulator GlxA family with amidase domain
MMMLSQMLDISGSEDVAEEPPAFVSEVLLYIQDNFQRRILAADLARRFGVGRTTLMTAFKKYTGSTVNGYIIDCRLKHAIGMLRQGCTQQSAAAASGFGDACNMIRAFHRRLGTTPGKYVEKSTE